MPWHDMGLAVIVLTIIVRIVLFPLSRKAVQAQMAMKALTPDIEAIKKRNEPLPPLEESLFSHRLVH
jgi:membrane protein insertase Oxa1/YidC/SpoIIIJ